MAKEILYDKLNHFRGGSRMKSHHEIITRLSEKLSKELPERKNLGRLWDITTQSKFVRDLGNPEASQYQECWVEFDKIYHNPIIDRIMKKAHWRKGEEYKAEDILQLVYMKGFRWNFKRVEKGKFRASIERMINDVLRDYFREAGQKNHPIFFNDYDPEDKRKRTPECERQEVVDIAMNLLGNYKEPERSVLNRIWKNEGKWPRSRELASIMGNNKSEENARQWKHRNKELWKNFLAKLKKALGESQ